MSNEPRDARGRFTRGAAGSLDAEAHRFEHDAMPMHVGDEHRKPLRATGREVLNSLHRGAVTVARRASDIVTSTRFEDALPTKGGGVEIAATHRLGSGGHLRTHARLEPSHITALTERGAPAAVTLPAAAAVALAHRGLVESGRLYAAHRPLPVGFSIWPGAQVGGEAPASPWARQAN